MKYFIVAGEKSGDLHGANLIKELNQLDNDANFRGIGGDLMKSQGLEILIEYNQLAFMGFLEVIQNLNTISKALSICKREILNWKPDAIILIDYPGFNMRLAKYAKSLSIPVHYYILPKVWAWNHRRVRKIAKYIDNRYSILPFENEFYCNHNLEVSYVGNPLIENIRNYNLDKLILSQIDKKELVAILPGSRKQEVRSMQEVLVPIIKFFNDKNFAICAVRNLPGQFYDVFRSLNNVQIVMDRPYEVLSKAQAAIVNSGTASLETALFEVPQVVCYKTSKLTYHIARHLIRVRFISLVNLIANKKIVTELIQKELNFENLKKELQILLEPNEVKEKMLDGYRRVKDKIGNKESSKIVADNIIRSISNEYLK